MQRTMLYALTLCLLLGVDIAFNDASITTGIWQAMVAAGQKTTRAIGGTIGVVIGNPD